MSLSDFTQLFQNSVSTVNKNIIAVMKQKIGLGFELFFTKLF